MASHGRLFIIMTTITLLAISRGQLSNVSPRYNIFDRQQKPARMKMNSDMRRIRQKLAPVRSLFTSRNLYREHYNMLKTQWTCCLLQRDHLFDRRDIHQTVIETFNCYDFIKHNQSQLSTECRANLKLFNPTRGDVPKCDGGLLRNIADEHAFVIQLANYTEKWCPVGLPPMLIFFNISQIIQCERAIRQKLINSPQAYATYDTLSSNLLRIYVQNLKKYYDCNDPQLWNTQDSGKNRSININYEY
jgi:hypothetical protein